LASPGDRAAAIARPHVLQVMARVTALRRTEHNLFCASLEKHMSSAAQERALRSSLLGVNQYTCGLSAPSELNGIVAVQNSEVFFALFSKDAGFGFGVKPPTYGSGLDDPREVEEHSNVRVAYRITISVTLVD